MQSGCSRWTMKLPLLGGTIYQQPVRARRDPGSVGEVQQVFIQSLAAGLSLHRTLQTASEPCPGRSGEPFLGNSACCASPRWMAKKSEEYIRNVAWGKWLRLLHFLVNREGFLGEPIKSLPSPGLRPVFGVKSVFKFRPNKLLKGARPSMQRKEQKVAFCHRRTDFMLKKKSRPDRGMNL